MEAFFSEGELRDDKGKAFSPIISETVAATYDSSVISVARRIAASDVSQRICRLPPRKGGLGLRTWGSTADNAFLAAYTHASHSFPILFLTARTFPT